MNKKKKIEKKGGIEKKELLQMIILILELLVVVIELIKIIIE
nr:MAG TPA: hypothetical protein [Caudoviricetes sp.]DAP25884.1 MAG TPA: hypothetical protein [Caudoviricetes sp.]